MAFSGGIVVGCGGLQSLADEIGEIKRMWVHREWRGLGLAGRLLRRLEEESARWVTRSSGSTPTARWPRRWRCIGAAGYVEIPRYNDNP